jgi:zinc protease
MQEEDTQSGLAHFLEHMAFNGSKNFPGRKKVVSFIENNGGQFGTNINAYTSYDETVYNLSDIILSRETVIDSCLLILHDWSGFLTLDNAEIDKEREIIKEEWRTRNDAQSRIKNQLNSVFFKGSKYAKRSPIGSMDVVGNFDYKELKDYYHKWYRPDLQGVVIVGDFDARLMEKKLKSVFADIPATINPAKRIYYQVPDNTESQIVITTDPETTSTSVSIFFKHDPVPDSIKMTTQGIYLSLLRTLATQAMSNRLSEISQKADAPFLSAGAGDGNFLVACTKDAWTMSAVPKEGNIKESLAVLLRENMRVYKYGFTDAEIDRIKASLLALYENLYNNRNKQSSIAYTNKYVRGFVDKMPVISIEFERELVKQLLPQIGPEELRNYINKIISWENTAIAITGPQKELIYPDEQEVLGLIKNIKEEKLTPYVEKTAASSILIEKLPRKGRIVKVATDSKWGTTNWTLSNGIHVVLKKTGYKDDQVTMTAVSPGGIIQFPDSDVINASMINGVAGLGGLASFSRSELAKMLAGKSAVASASVSLTTQEISGRSSIKEMETLFQIVYLQLTAPRKDEEAYSIFIEQLRDKLRNTDKNPLSEFNDTIMHLMYGENPRVLKMRPEDVDKLNYDRIMEMYRTCFSNLGSLTFTFVGTIDENDIKPLVERYLASLPSGKPLKYKIEEDPFQINKGLYLRTIREEMQTPRASVFQLYSGVIKRNLKNNLILDLFRQVLGLMFNQNVREDAGGTYGINTNISCSRFPEGLTKIEIAYDTDPAKLDRIKPIVHACVKHVAKEGVPQEVLDMLAEYTLKEIESSRKTDEYWTSVLSTYYLYGEDIDTDVDSLLKSVTSEDLRIMANEILSQNNQIEVIMLPK